MCGTRASVILYLKQRGLRPTRPGTVVGVVPGLLLMHGVSGTDGRSLAAPFPFALEVCVLFIAVRDFSLSGRGSPAPIGSPKMLVATGLYTRVRNSMYIGILLACG